MSYNLFSIVNLCVLIISRNITFNENIIFDDSYVKLVHVLIKKIQKIDSEWNSYLWKDHFVPRIPSI